MTAPIKQHLIDPELCIRCHTCEEACTIDAITHNDDNVVVDASICNGCMDCISPCPTGSIDNWRVVNTPYSLDEQLGWTELPEQQDLAGGIESQDGAVEAFDADISALLEEAHQGAGGQMKPPLSASKPAVNLFPPSDPAEAIVQGNFRLTSTASDSDVRHIIVNLGTTHFPVLEGQSVGVIAPGTDGSGRPHRPRLYSVSSPRDGERPNTNNLSLTVKREDRGVCSNYLCDLNKGDPIRLTGPFGATFLMPDDPQARLIMVCTGTGSAPFRAFTMRHQRAMPDVEGALHLFFGARTPDSLPYFGPLKKVPDAFLAKHFAFSRVAGQSKEYVQDKLRAAGATLAPLLPDQATHVYVCGLKAMETGVEGAFEEIARGAGLNWLEIRAAMRDAGRYHVETY